MIREIVYVPKSKTLFLKTKFFQRFRYRIAQVTANCRAIHMERGSNKAVARAHCQPAPAATQEAFIRISPSTPAFTALPTCFPARVFKARSKGGKTKTAKSARNIPAVVKCPVRQATAATVRITKIYNMHAAAMGARLPPCTSPRLTRVTAAIYTTGITAAQAAGK